VALVLSAIRTRLSSLISRREAARASKSLDLSVGLHVLMLSDMGSCESMLLSSRDLLLRLVFLPRHV
jgi:hypothetical protein